MTDRPLHYRTITELAAMVRSGAVTPTGLTEHLIGRIEALNGPLNAFNLVTADRAMAEAESAERLMASGRDLGPLHGIPYAVKDLYDIAGLPTTAGSRTVDDAPRTEESEVTRRLAATSSSFRRSSSAMSSLTAGCAPGARSEPGISFRLAAFCPMLRRADGPSVSSALRRESSGAVAFFALRAISEGFGPFA